MLQEGKYLPRIKFPDIDENKKTQNDTKFNLSEIIYEMRRHL